MQPCNPNSVTLCTTACVVAATPEEISAAFTEWIRRYQANPGDVEAEIKSLREGDPKTYGDDVTPYFISLINEQTAKRPSVPLGTGAVTVVATLPGTAGPFTPWPLETR